MGPRYVLPDKKWSDQLPRPHRTRVPYPRDEATAVATQPTIDLPSTSKPLPDHVEYQRGLLARCRKVQAEAQEVRRQSRALRTEWIHPTVHYEVFVQPPPLHKIQGKRALWPRQDWLAD